MIRLTLAFNAIHLEAARRLRTTAAPPQAGRPRRGPSLQLLVLERSRMRLEPGDRRLWSVCLPVQPAVMALLALLAALGLVEEVRLPHLRNAGRALRFLVRRCPAKLLLDDGLDQYRARPRALDPAAFLPGTPLALFSDQPEARAPWCRRFQVLELGPLYPTRTGAGAPVCRPEAMAAGASGTLIVDAPGVDRLMAEPARLPRPWRLLPHPVAAKRCWRLPCEPAEPEPGPVLSVEQRIAGAKGLVVVGESMVLLAAVALRPPGTPLLVALPADSDPHLQDLVVRLADRDPTIHLA